MGAGRLFAAAPTPRGRPIPVDSRSHDRWCQHIAIIVSDTDRAYAWLRQHRVEHASPAPQRLPDWNVNATAARRPARLRQRRERRPTPGSRVTRWHSNDATTLTTRLYATMDGAMRAMR